MKDKALFALITVMTAMMIVQFNYLDSIRKQLVDNGIAIHDNRSQIESIKTKIGG